MNNYIVIGKLTTEYLIFKDHYLITIDIGTQKISCKLFDKELITLFESMYIGDGYSHVICTIEKREFIVNDTAIELAKKINSNVVTLDGKLKLLVIVDMWISED